jgi:hypothetical protein
VPVIDILLFPESLDLFVTSSGVVQESLDLFIASPEVVFVFVVSQKHRLGLVVIALTT